MRLLWFESLGFKLLTLGSRELTASFRAEGPGPRRRHARPSANARPKLRLSSLSAVAAVACAWERVDVGDEDGDDSDYDYGNEGKCCDLLESRHSDGSIKCFGVCLVSCFASFSFRAGGHVEDSFGSLGRAEV